MPRCLLAALVVVSACKSDSEPEPPPVERRPTPQIDEKKQAPPDAAPKKPGVRVPGNQFSFEMPAGWQLSAKSTASEMLVTGDGHEAFLVARGESASKVLATNQACIEGGRRAAKETGAVFVTASLVELGRFGKACTITNDVDKRRVYSVTFAAHTMAALHTSCFFDAKHIQPPVFCDEILQSLKLEPVGL